MYIVKSQQTVQVQTVICLSLVCGYHVCQCNHITLVNVYVDLVVFTHVAGTS